LNKFSVENIDEWKIILSTFCSCPEYEFIVSHIDQTSLIEKCVLKYRDKKMKQIKSTQSKQSNDETNEMINLMLIDLPTHHPEFEHVIKLIVYEQYQAYYNTIINLKYQINPIHRSRSELPQVNSSSDVVSSVTSFVASLFVSSSCRRMDRSTFLSYLTCQFTIRKKDTDQMIEKFHNLSLNPVSIALSPPSMIAIANSKSTKQFV
jgi:hypothetical protein